MIKSSNKKKTLQLMHELEKCFNISLKLCSFMDNKHNRIWRHIRHTSILDAAISSQCRGRKTAQMSHINPIIYLKAVS